MPYLPSSALASVDTSVSNALYLQTPFNNPEAPTYSGLDSPAEWAESPVFLLVEELIKSGDGLQATTPELTSTSQPDRSSPWDTIKDESALFDPSQAWEGFLNILKMLLEKVETTLGPPFSKATQAVQKFHSEHPSWTIIGAILIALAGLGVLYPPILTTIGFGVQGVIKGILAAAWQVGYYGGYIPARYTFSILRSLGATAYSTPRVAIFTVIAVVIGLILCLTFALHAGSDDPKGP